MLTFSNAKEFANFIKTSRYSPEFNEDPENYKRRTEFLENFYKEDGREIYDPINTRYHKVVELLINEFYTQISEKHSILMKEYFYFSTCETESLNAQIHRSPDLKYFAVIINSALIDLLTKVGKFDYAIHYPDSVEFCSRIYERKPTLTELKEMRNEYYDHFKKYKVAAGPFIVLDQNTALMHFARLNIQEKFILFHEIAHFLNGDMSDDGELLSGDFFHYIENIHHRKEHFADIIAFNLLINSEKNEGELSHEKRLSMLFAIIHLFDIFYAVQGDESSTHPHPIKRIYCISDHFYGDHFTAVIEETYHDKTAFSKLTTMLDKIDSLENTINEVVDCLFKNAFDNEE